MEYLIISAFVKHCYNAMPGTTPEGRYVVKAPAGLTWLMFISFLLFAALTVYFSFFDPARLKDGADTWVAAVIFGVFDASFFLAVLYFHLTRIEYDSIGMTAHSLFDSGRLMPWTAIAGMKFSAFKEMVITAADGTKIKYSCMYSGFRHLTEELQRRVPAARQGESIRKFNEDVNNHLK
jgi:uncharacterized membrane protein (DUF485 family)